MKWEKRVLTKSSYNQHLIRNLINLSNTLDRKGFTKEADDLDCIIKEALMEAPMPIGYDKAKEKFDKTTKQLTSKDALDLGQQALSVLGLIPGAGEPFDATNAAISAARGDVLGTIFNSLSVIPTVGDIIGKGSKLLLDAIRRKSGTLNFLGKTYSVQGLADYLYSNMNKAEQSIKDMLSTVEETLSMQKGQLYSVYLKQIKNPIQQTALKTAA